MSRTRVPEIDLVHLRCSVLLIEPKEEFLELLGSTPQIGALGDVYFAEENGAWLVPPISGFEDELSFENYVDELKPRLLRVEIGRFPELESSFPHPINAETFDRFFRILVRDSVSDVREL